MKVCISVLHFGAVSVTKTCVDSLLALDPVPSVEVSILIVNNTGDATCMEEFLNRYRDASSVVLLDTGSNLGFSGGNNFAYRYLKDEVHADIAVILNNDIEIEQRDFVARMVEEQRLHHFDVLAIDVYDRIYDQHQSPLCLGQDIRTYAAKIAKGNEIFASMEGVAFLRLRAVLWVKRKICRIESIRQWCIRRDARALEDAAWKERQDDAIAHGSCVILGPRFIEQMENAFNPATFMYFEECLQKLMCDEKGLRTSYTPDLQVIHHHDYLARERLDDLTGQAFKRRALMTLDSYKVLLDAMGQN